MKNYNEKIDELYREIKNLRAAQADFINTKYYRIALVITDEIRQLEKIIQQLANQIEEKQNEK